MSEDTTAAGVRETVLLRTDTVRQLLERGTISETAFDGRAPSMPATARKTVRQAESNEARSSDGDECLRNTLKFGAECETRPRRAVTRQAGQAKDMTRTAMEEAGAAERLRHDFIARAKFHSRTPAEAVPVAHAIFVDDKEEAALEPAHLWTNFSPPQHTLYRNWNSARRP
ncbi:hypothetical protein JIQ42_07887 [Leishmania sp. Namibia]|uniref:hypothetical protein n=1 Tax=Leishmania sp. Namibia TaxID=2802991 RepID=UPI001B6ACB5D|nr:hypothetical protein JIQ42_07887 [Leishmania sp. Namibia]